VAGQRTLWEEGRYTGRLVAFVASAAAVVVVGLNLVGAGQIGLFFDLSFVLICVAAALAIRPTEFFVVGVLPPLLMLGTVTLLALVDRTSVADADDSIVQAVVSGLAHHATALVVGYALTLTILALRQVALRNHGRLRASERRRTRRPAAPTPAPRATQPSLPREPRGVTDPAETQHNRVVQGS
jgi:hypothetical protein